MMNDRDLQSFADRMKQIAQDCDFGEDEILAIAYSRYGVSRKIEVLLSPNFDIRHYAKVLKAELKQEKLSHTIKDYFIYGGVKFCKIK